MATETATRDTCRRCHRPLRASTGIGPTCARREAVEREYSKRQVTDAAELAELGGVVRLRRGVYLTVGSRGGTYRTTRTTCTCSAGLAGKACYHTAAVRLRTGTPPAPRLFAVPSAFTVAA